MKNCHTNCPVATGWNQPHKHFLPTNTALDSCIQLSHFKTFGIFIQLFKLTFIKQICVVSDKIASIHSNSYSSWSHRHVFIFYLLHYLSLCSYSLAELLRFCSRETDWFHQTQFMVMDVAKLTLHCILTTF